MSDWAFPLPDFVCKRNQHAGKLLAGYPKLPKQEVGRRAERVRVGIQKNEMMQYFIKHINTCALGVILFSAMVTDAHAQVWEGSHMSSTDKSNPYNVEFFGDIEIGDGGSLSDAVMKGKGQYLEGNLLITAEKITEVTKSKITVTVKEAPLSFTLTPSTFYCDGKRLIRPAELKVGDMVTITTKAKSKTAISVRKGPMMFKGMGPGSRIVNFQCKR